MLELTVATKCRDSRKIGGLLLRVNLSRGRLGKIFPKELHPLRDAANKLPDVSDLA